MNTVSNIVLGQYRIIKQIGSGGLGRVFQALDQTTGHIVAVKILHDKFQTNPKRLGFFHRELMIAAKLKHKNIVNCLDANFQPPNCFIVSEFVDGWSLYHLIKTVKQFPPLVALCIAIDMLQGIDYLHLHDTIHSDLSSPNVMIDKSGRVLVTDFGLACEEEIEDYKSYVVGTPGYYSPEHVSQASICPASDLYCVGLLLYEMLTGTKAVVPSLRRQEVIASMDRIDFDRIRSTDRKLQRILRRLLKKALAMSLRRRYQSAEAMIYDIYHLLKRYQIDYARYGIKQFLLDRKLSTTTTKERQQDIYHGFTEV